MGQVETALAASVRHGSFQGMGDEIRVEEAREVSEDLRSALGSLVGQLSSSSPVPLAADLDEIVRSSATCLLVARDAEERVLGMLTLVLFRIPTGVRAWIEDVVVDQQARGRGVGQKLTSLALRIARDRGARTVELTSRPSRLAANRMYQKLGFVARDTNVYRLDFSAPKMKPEGLL